MDQTPYGLMNPGEEGGGVQPAPSPPQICLKSERSKAFRRAQQMRDNALGSLIPSYHGNLIVDALCTEDLVDVNDAVVEGSRAGV